MMVVMIMMITMISEYKLGPITHSFFRNCNGGITDVQTCEVNQPQGLFMGAHSPWKAFFRWLAPLHSWYLLRSCTLSGAVSTLSKIIHIHSFSLLNFFPQYSPLSYVLCICYVYIIYFCLSNRNVSIMNQRIFPLNNNKINHCILMSTMMSDVHQVPNHYVRNE